MLILIYYKPPLMTVLGAGKQKILNSTIQNKNANRLKKM